jgi:hypothetical protein
MELVDGEALAQKQQEDRFADARAMRTALGRVPKPAARLRG